MHWDWMEWVPKQVNFMTIHQNIFAIITHICVLSMLAHILDWWRRLAFSSNRFQKKQIRLLQRWYETRSIHWSYLGNDINVLSTVVGRLFESRFLLRWSGTINSTVWSTTSTGFYYVQWVSHLLDLSSRELDHRHCTLSIVFPSSGFTVRCSK